MRSVSMLFCLHRSSIQACGRGGIGRRAWFRSMWGLPHEGSSPFARTIHMQKSSPAGSSFRLSASVFRCFSRCEDPKRKTELPRFPASKRWGSSDCDGGCIDSSHPDCEFRIMNGSVGHLAAFHRPEHTEEDRTARPILFRESMQPCIVRRSFYPFAMAMPTRAHSADASSSG